jgi:hypothetical protein
MTVLLKTSYELTAALQHHYEENCLNLSFLAPGGLQRCDKTLSHVIE